MSEVKVEGMPDDYAGYRWLLRLEPLFAWLKIFYPDVYGMNKVLLFRYFVPQKILRINGRCSWPVHPTSTVLYPGRIQLGKRSFPGNHTHAYIQARNGIFIGNNLRTGPGIGLISANHNLEDYDKHLPSEPIRIGDNVWIGMNSVVLPGVQIGDNVVVGAGSVVKKDIPSNCVAAGNPCRVIRDKPLYSGRDYGHT